MSEEPLDFRIEKYETMIETLEHDLARADGSDLAAVSRQLQVCYDRLAELQGTGEDLAIDQYEGRGNVVPMHQGPERGPQRAKPVSDRRGKRAIKP